MAVHVLLSNGRPFHVFMHKLHSSEHQPEPEPEPPSVAKINVRHYCNPLLVSGLFKALHFWERGKWSKVQYYLILGTGHK